MNTQGITVYLLRHGHSQQNKIAETADLPGLLLKRNTDLPLSTLGEAQCNSFNGQLDLIEDVSKLTITNDSLRLALEFVSKKHSWLFASSPLHRALQTTKLCFKPFASAIHVLDEASELPMWFNNRPSTPLQELGKELAASLHKEPHIAKNTGEPARNFILALLELHQRHPNKTIVCTTHSLLIRKIANSPFTSADPKLKRSLVPNCGLLRLDITWNGSPENFTEVKMQQVPLITKEESFHYNKQLAKNILLYNNTAVAVFLALLNRKSVLQTLGMPPAHTNA